MLGDGETALIEKMRFRKLQPASNKTARTFSESGRALQEGTGHPVQTEEL